MMTARIKVSDLAKGWMKDPAFKAEYDALEEEFSAAAFHIRAQGDSAEASTAKDCECDGDEAVKRH
jgi:hypothetical protein